MLTMSSCSSPPMLCVQGEYSELFETLLKRMTNSKTVVHCTFANETVLRQMGAFLSRTGRERHVDFIVVTLQQQESRTSTPSLLYITVNSAEEMYHVLPIAAEWIRVRKIGLPI